MSQTPDHSSTPIHSEFASDPDMIELVDLFVSELPDRIDQMTQAFESQQFTDLKRLMHQLRGASGGYGFPTIGISAGFVESLLSESTDLSAQVEDIDSQLQELISLCRRASSS